MLAVGTTAWPGSDQSRSWGSGWEVWPAGSPWGLVSHRFSPILPVDFRDLFLEQVLSQSLDVLEVIREELQQRSFLLPTAVWGHQLTHALDAPGSPIPFSGAQVQELEKGRGKGLRLSLGLDSTPNSYIMTFNLSLCFLSLVKSFW